jgi:hypothetical protein
MGRARTVETVVLIPEIILPAGPIVLVLVVIIVSILNREERPGGLNR